MKSLSNEQIEILEHIGKGRSYDQILQALPHLSYIDIFTAARLASESLRERQAEYADRMDKIHQKHPRAYEKWSDDEDNTLRSLAASGKEEREISELLQRQPGAIRSRMMKLGLLVDDQLV